MKIKRILDLIKELHLENINSFISKMNNDRDCWCGLSRNPSVTMDHVLAHPDKPWNWKFLSGNPRVTMDHVLAHPDKPWNWNFLSGNPSVTMDHVLAHPDKPWEWYYLSENPSVTMDHVLAHLDMPWNWSGLVQNESIFEIDLDRRLWEHISASKIQSCWRTSVSNPNFTLCRKRLLSEYLGLIE